MEISRIHVIWRIHFLALKPDICRYNNLCKLRISFRLRTYALSLTTSLMRVWYININIVVLSTGVTVPLYVAVGIASIHTYRVTSCIVTRLIAAMNSVTAGQVIAVTHWQVCVDQLTPTVDTCQSLSHTVHAPVPLILLLSCLYIRQLPAKRYIRE